ncbi:MAG: VWA domain-containing protein [Granulosicoccus sp.]
MIDTDLTWLRPIWLWGFLPLLAALFFWFRQSRTQSEWESIVDAELRPYVLEESQSTKRFSPWLLFLAWGLCLLLLAGPVWQQQEVPVFQAQQSEVILFDLSRSMRADDISPDRLTRARFKLLDLLDQSKGRNTGLIAFAERPYVISPLTDDAKTIAAFVPSLDPDIMPVQGSRLDLAIDKAVSLLLQAGVSRGHIILITDDAVNDADRSAASSATSQGHKLSVLGIGTAAGSPLRDESGQFLQEGNGAIVVPQLDMNALETLAAAGDGVAVKMTADASDLDRLNDVRQAIAISSGADESLDSQIYWIEYAPWAIWLLVIALLVSFRKGIVT